MTTLSINEVDCYIGNALTTKYATDRAVQHQILLEGKPIGRLNKVADDGRHERIVLNKPVNDAFSKLFNQIIEIKEKMKSEHCNSMEEYNAAAKFNDPFKNSIDDIIIEMWKIESLDLEIEKYKQILLY